MDMILSPRFLTGLVVAGIIVNLTVLYNVSQAAPSIIAQPTHLIEKNRIRKPKFKKVKDITPTAVKSKDFTAAGVVFTDGKLILGAYQPEKKKPFISGIGGGREEGETFEITAIREMLEELFEYRPTDPALVLDVLSQFSNYQEKQLDNYKMMVYTFEDLENILQYVATKNIPTKMYDVFPTTLNELLFTRKVFHHTEFVPELSHLCLLPIVKHNLNQPFVSMDFLREILMYAKE